jgi:hypothetical protein
MLQAIAKSGGDRAKATAGLFGLNVTNGILGNFTINATGDTNLTQITIYKQIGKNLIPVRTLVPDASILG